MLTSRVERRRGERSRTVIDAGAGAGRDDARPGRVLVVDDDPLIRALVVEVLGSQGHEVLVAADLTAARAQGSDGEVELLLLDVQLAEGDALAALPSLRNVAGLAASPVVCISGWDDTHTKARAFDLGVVDFMTKPFGPRELEVRVRTHLANHRRRQRSERRLSEREAQLGTLFDALPEMVMLKDAAGRYRLVNQPAAAWLGRRPDELVGRTDEELFPSDEAARIAVAEHRAVTATEPRRSEQWATNARGERRRLELLRTPVRDPGADLIGVLTIARDVTEQAAASERLAASETHLRQAQAVAAVGSWTLDRESGELAWTEQTYRLFGVPVGTPVDLELVLARVHPDDRAALRAAWEDAQTSGSFRSDHRVLIDGEVRWVAEQAIVDPTDSGSSVVVGTVLDITQRVLAQQALEAQQRTLEAQQQRLDDALSAAGAGTWELALDQAEVRVDPSWYRLVGEPGAMPATLPAADWFARLHPEDRAAVEAHLADLDAEVAVHESRPYRVRHADGGWRWLQDRMRVVARSDDGAVAVVRGIALDVTAARTHQEALDFVAVHDRLTGLPNREGFTDLLEARLAGDRAASSTGDRAATTSTGDRAATQLVLCCIDLDDFERVRRELGEVAGNHLLTEVANRLVGAVGAHHLVARISRDEFAVLRVEPVGAPPDPEAWWTTAEQLRQLVGRPMRFAGEPLRTTASVGVTVLEPDRSVDADQLLREAEQAVYQAKVAGRNRTARFDPVRDDRRRLRFGQLARLRAALTAGEFVLHYQPQVELRTGRLLGCEALLRWQHPDRGLVPPAGFVPVLASDPLVAEVGDWVVREAVAQLGRWQAAGLTTRVSVNLDPVQVQSPDLPERIVAHLADVPGLSPEHLGLELLETGELEDVDTVARFIERMQRHGISVALDDFGTGYASLTLLKRLAARWLKIDRSFVTGLLSDPESAVIVSGILSLAGDFQREVLAEGVESEAHGRLLIELGCAYGQGYAIAAAMPADELPRWVAAWEPPASWRDTVPIDAEGLPGLLADLEHRAWLHRLDDYVRGRVAAPPPLDPGTCQLSGWLDRFVVLDDPSRAEALDTLHREVHRTARQLVAARAGGRDGEVQALRPRVQARSDELLRTLREIRQSRA